MLSDRPDSALNDGLEFIHSTFEHEPFNSLKVDSQKELDDLSDIEILTDKPAFGKRSAKKLALDFIIWFFLTIYAILLITRGQGKDGYILAIIIYVFISLRLLARHVSMSICVYQHVGMGFDFLYDRTVGLIPPRLRIVSLFALTFSALLLTALISPSDPTFSSVSERIQSLLGVVAILVFMTFASEVSTAFFNYFRIDQRFHGIQLAWDSSCSI